MKRIILIQSLALLGNAQSLPGLQSFPDAMLGFGRDIFGFLVKGIPYGPAPTGCSEYEIIVGMNLAYGGKSIELTPDQGVEQANLVHLAS